MLTQVVFLIDTNIEECYTENNTSLSNYISLSCLRILHTLSANEEKRGYAKTTKFLHTPIKWSYKFFNSNSFGTKIESHRFYDFKLKYFDEFENEIQRRFESSLAKSKDVASVSQSKSCDILNLAFMQLLSDFHWENPDITSPVKGRRTRKDGHSQRNNYAVVFTKCPKNPAQLKQFCGKQVPDFEVFRDSLFPGNLLEQFHSVSKLNLHWIDTQHVDYHCETDVRSIQIIEEALQEVGGSLLPLDALVQHGSLHYSLVTAVLDDKNVENEITAFTEGKNEGQPHFLPCVTVLNTFFKKKYQKHPTPESQALDCVEINVGRSKFHITLKMRENWKGDLPKDVGSSKDDSKLFSSSLKAYGVLQNTRGRQVDTHDSWICCESVSSGAGRKQTPVKNGLFENLLEKLAIRKSSMVLICDETGSLLLLQPLTVSSATLSLVSQQSLVTTEKLLVSQEQEVDEEDFEEGSCDSLINRLVGKVSIPQGPGDSSCTSRDQQFDGRMLDRWQIPGPSKSFQKLINTLNQRLSDLDFLSEEETKFLKQLQKHYKQDTKPPGLRETPVAIDTESKKEDEKDKLDLPYKGKVTRASLSRAEVILNKSMAVVKERDQIKEESSTDKEKPDIVRPDIASHLADFSSTAELKAYLVSTYDKVCTGEVTSIDTTVQTLVTVAFHYLKQTDGDAAEETCKTLLEESILLTGGQLREKYTKNDGLSKEQKIAEYECQVLIRLEIMSTLDNKDQAEGEEDVNDEIVSLLRTLSFMSESGLSKFMESSLLNNYIHTIPRTLANIYDELMQPLPESLASLLSPHNSSADDQSVFDSSLLSNDAGPPSARTRSHGLGSPLSSGQPRSNRSVNLDTSLTRPSGSRRLVHHPSLADFGAKRQIVVQKISKPKSSRSSKKNKEHKKSRDKVTKSLFDQPHRGTKLERRQSVAVMQSSNKTPKHSWKSPRRRIQSPRRHLVAETPSHKQVTHLLNTPDDQHRRHSLATEVPIIEESPEKAIRQVLKDTPTKGKRAKALLRRSFYSAGPAKRTKNLTQYFQLADRIAGRQREPSGLGSDVKKPAKLLSFDSSQLMSPDKNNSSFLLSQLAASPSPAKATPKKLTTQTPSKLLESPSQNTRSKQVAATAINLFRSPTTSHRVASPRCRLLQSPVNRRQSPRVLALESDVKAGPGSPETTPEKEPVCGVISAGLDSPSQNTRLRSAQTPTRKSVRAALFAKSPRARGIQSPLRNNYSPRTLTARFGSPCKQNINTTQPNAKVCQPLNSSELDSESKAVENDSIKVKRDNPILSMMENANSVKPIGNPQKTPSPRSKKVTKTPDSFSKWHRRKPRSNQSSPAVQKTQVATNTDSFMQLSQENVAPEKIDHALKPVQGTLRNKRCLLQSPEKSIVESPSKRARVAQIRQSSMALSAREGSQGFEPSGSFGDISQISTLSSEYFSVTNDEVFLSQRSDASEKAELEEIENVRKIRFRRKSSMLTSSQGFTSSPRRKALERLISSDIEFMDTSDNERSESPIFGASRSTTKSRNKMIDNVLTQNSEDFSRDGAVDVMTTNSSPKFTGISPNTKKYSPNVSAKSLMHLIQSPLLKSPEGPGVEGTTARGGKGTSSGTRSRRSLQMFN